MIVEQPLFLWMIIPLFFILAIIIRKNVVTLDDDAIQNKKFMRRRRALKVFIFFTRFFIFSLILVFLARPFIELETTEQGDPKLTLLIDNSSSMQVFDMSFIDDLKKELGRELPLDVKMISSDALVSDIGEDILRYVEEDANILLVSDFQVTEGIPLTDVATFARAINTSLSAVSLTETGDDTSVWISGPSKGIAKDSIQFQINVNSLKDQEYNLVISVDNQTKYNMRDSKKEILISEEFDEGTHTIVAKILGDDQIPENNVFYKTIHIMEKPKVLYVTRTSSQLPQLLSLHYDVTTDSDVPDDLDSYYAVIIEDMNNNQLRPSVDKLSDYVNEGNGLFMIGGINSYDRGRYKQSSLEALLPVKIGRGEKKQGDSNIVILIDMSGSTQNYWVNEGGKLTQVKGEKPLDVIKALAIDVIETLNVGNKVGVVAFAIPDPENAFEGKFKAVKVTDVKPLTEIKELAVDKISRIDTQGQSLFDVGLSGAYTLLKETRGSKNIILVSDGGRNIYPKVKDAALSNVDILAQSGIKTYAVGVGRDVDNDFLTELTQRGNGLYFPASKTNTLKVLFGTPEEKNQGDEMELVILNPNHFVTRDLTLDAKIYGFNQVVPKTFARVLVTTDSGEPALVEWRYGIGRVLSLTVFSGTSGLGQLLSGENSRLLTRSINYLIGNPERKEEYLVTIDDTYEGKFARVSVVSDNPVTSSIELTKVRENEYEGKLFVNSTGVQEFLDRQFAVNYPREYLSLGQYDQLPVLLESTEGKLFDPSEPKEIAEHVKTISKRVRIEKTYIDWHIIAAIILIYFFEIICRKMIEQRKKI